jgi:hypothetical protein
MAIATIFLHSSDRSSSLEIGSQADQGWMAVPCPQVETPTLQTFRPRARDWGKSVSLSNK